MSETMHGPTYMLVYTRDSGACRCTLGDEPELDAAVQRWLDSRRTHDTLVLLTTVEGCAYKVLASEVTSWLVSTPASRAAADALEAALKAENANPWEGED